MIFVLGGCADKVYSKQESAFIVFKTPTVKHADLGFIYEGNDGLKVELYSAGQAVMALEITETSVCMSLLECMGKKSFNAEVLSSAYPESILDNIFTGKSIFHGQNKQTTRNGFTQHIRQANKYDINYSVLNNETIFRDTMNQILIKIKRL
jgi:hypothetical protein